MSLLLDNTVKVSLMVVLALGATVLLRRHSAAMRHWVLTVAITCAVAMPLLGLLVPSWPSSLTMFASGPQRERIGFVPSQTIVVQEPPATTHAALADRPLAKTTAPVGVVQFVVVGWVVGAGISLSVLFVGLTRLRRLASSARRIEGGRWVELAHEIAGTFGLRRSVILLQSDHPRLLVTWGLVRPKILLPVTACDWPDDRARIVLRHELAHVHRGDWVVQMSAGVLRALYWFNPLVWIACGRLRQESEHACDDVVLNGGIDGPDYATHLLDLARTLNTERRAWLPAPAMARPSSLEGRIHAMLNASINRNPLTTSARVAILIALLSVAVPIAGAQSSFFTFSGSIVDQTNRVIPNATLVLTNADTQAKYEVRSDGTGHFEFVGLPNAQYALEVKDAGFTTLKDAVRIAGRNMERTFQLQIGSLEETITVTDRGQARVVVPTAKVQEMRRQAQQRRQSALEKCSASPPPGPVGGNILQPTKLVDVKPKYPGYLKDSKIGGVVTMDALIGADGNVRDVRVLDSPHPDLGNAAVEAVLQWQYSSTLLNCTPIEVRMKVTTTFRIQP
jgi:TonB family protein